MKKVRQLPVIIFAFSLIITIGITINHYNNSYINNNKNIYNEFFGASVSFDYKEIYEYKSFKSDTDFCYLKQIKVNNTDKLEDSLLKTYKYSSNIDDISYYNNFNEFADWWNFDAQNVVCMYEYFGETNNRLGLTIQEIRIIIICKNNYVYIADYTGNWI